MAEGEAIRWRWAAVSRHGDKQSYEVILVARSARVVAEGVATERLGGR